MDKVATDQTKQTSPDDIQVEMPAQKSEFTFNPDAQVFKPNLNVESSVFVPTQTPVVINQPLQSENNAKREVKFNLNAKFVPSAIPGGQAPPAMGGFDGAGYGAPMGQQQDVANLTAQFLKLQYQLQLQQYQALTQQNTEVPKKKKKKSKRNKKDKEPEKEEAVQEAEAKDPKKKEVTVKKVY